ncbi:hypothetical protein JTE90_019691 [Oedothorax gibbosus]|uniref:Uncharacterized protein n=1 Tax=Oedothorax gibbosus TaxID=931172 RepID=A0AAV6UG96_9ARAC|nr:hypothetical protein JTE90_019691 [Oedothorax gibbosus]
MGTTRASWDVLEMKTGSFGGSLEMWLAGANSPANLLNTSRATQLHEGHVNHMRTFFYDCSSTSKALKNLIRYAEETLLQVSRSVCLETGTDFFAEYRMRNGSDDNDG